VSHRRSSEETQATRDSLVAAALQIVRRAGARALTMRAVAQEAGCSVGLPYKIFANREELVLDLIAAELTEVSRALDGWIRSAGKHTTGGNLDRFASILLESETPALLHANEIDDVAFEQRLRGITAESGILRSFDEAIAQYLKEEQRLGRIRSGIDTAAFGFLITGAIHNLVTAGEQYPRPARAALRRYLRSCAEAIAPAGV
jgi:AcrR family transcriptional regulator